MADVVKFQKILDTLAKQATDTYRKASFQKAKNALTIYPNGAISMTDAKKLPGFGKGILGRLEEFINTGTLVELKGFSDESKVLDLFQGIYAVGPVLAGKWYTMGYRSLSDIPLDSLTKGQQLGLTYYNDINSRIPREEIIEIEKKLTSLITSYNQIYSTNIRGKICGSYLRGKKDSGDIDMVLAGTVDSSGNHIVRLIQHMFPVVEHVLALGKSKVLALGGLATAGSVESYAHVGCKRRRIDFELISHEDWAFAQLYFTGSKEFNKHMRGVAKDKGYLLNQEGIFDGQHKYSMSTEQEIFEFLDMKYLTPEERDM